MLLLVSQASASTSLTYDYDANGNLISGDGKYYEYNDANQLVRVRFGDQNGLLLEEYVYDYQGQRVKKIENGVTTYYIGKHFETQVGDVGSGNTSYYFANGERVAKKDSSGNISYYLSDHLGSTNVVTDSSGNLSERIRYYPFGEFREGGNERYAYTGKERDRLTDFYYYEARYYNPGFVHFTQADTIVPNLYDPQNLNRYAYVRNNPLKLIDPSGHESWFSQKWNQVKTWARDTFGPAEAPQLVQIDPEAYRRASPEAKENVKQSVQQQQQYIQEFNNAQQDYVDVLNTTETGLKIAEGAGKGSTFILKVNPATKGIGNILSYGYLGADIYKVSQNSELSIIGKQSAIEGRVFLKMTSDTVGHGISKSIATKYPILSPIIDNDIASGIFAEGYSSVGKIIVDYLSKRVP